MHNRYSCHLWKRKKRKISFNCLQNQGLANETANAQIDTLILDNRKKLNEIIGENPMRYIIIYR